MFGRLLAGTVGPICTFSGALVPNGILVDAKFTLRPSLAFSYICSVTARHSSSVRQPTLQHGIFARQGGHPVRHWAVELSSCILPTCNEVTFSCKYLLNFYFVVYFARKHDVTKVEMCAS